MTIRAGFHHRYPTMPQLRIQGGRSLRGEIEVSGAKNAALPIMAASILASEPVRLEEVPRLADVRTLARMLKRLGVAVRRADDGALLLETVDPAPVQADYALVRRMRASFCVLGPLLARRGEAVVALPGGCNIGDRPVDLHLAGLRALGAELRIEHGYVVAQARRLRGTTISMSGPRGPTVTGTANVLMAAVLAEGVTTLHGAAVEPEIVDLGGFLVALGAKIAGLGTSTIEVTGVRQLGGTDYRIIPDRIEAATLLLAAAITRGSVTIVGALPEHLDEVLAALRRTGFRCEVEEERITLRADAEPRPVDLTALPYPGIPTDIQAQWLALLSVVPGRSRLRDGVFPERFMHVAELNRLGGRITCHEGAALIDGVARLTGATVTATDLRASAALVLAGLAAKGETILRGVGHLDRGYQRLDAKLRTLGARIERIETTSPSRCLESAIVPRPAH